MFVAIALIPEGPEALAQAAALSGLARADVSRLLAGTLPRVLCRQTGEGARLVQALEGAGFVAFTGEPAAIPTDAHRVVARNLELGPQGLVAVDGRGGRHDCPYAALHTLFRGSRPLVTSETVKTTERRLAMGKALLTGGLSVTKKIETVSERTTTAKEAFVLLQCWPDRPEIILYEHRLNYQCLGADLQPSTLGNQAASWPASGSWPPRPPWRTASHARASWRGCRPFPWIRWISPCSSSPRPAPGAAEGARRPR